MYSMSKADRLALRQLAFVIIGTGSFAACAISAVIAGSGIALIGSLVILALTVAQATAIGATRRE